MASSACRWVRGSICIRSTEAQNRKRGLRQAPPVAGSSGQICLAAEPRNPESRQSTTASTCGSNRQSCRFSLSPVACHDRRARNPPSIISQCVSMSLFIRAKGVNEHLILQGGLELSLAAQLRDIYVKYTVELEGSVPAQPVCDGIENLLILIHGVADSVSVVNGERPLLRIVQQSQELVLRNSAPV